MAGKKTGGKTSGKKAPSTKKAATPKEKRNDGIFLDRVPEKYIKAEDGYSRVTFLKDNKRHSFLVNPGQIFDIQKKNSDETVKGFKNILVGYPESEIEVSCNVADKNGKFPPRFNMSPADIKDCYDKAGAEIKANKAAKKAAERETPDVAEAAEAEAQAEK